jgi:hypothetical protein
MSNSSPKSLAHLLQSVPGVSIPSDAALLWVQRIVTDARKVQPGDYPRCAGAGSSRSSSTYGTNGRTSAR